MSETKLDEKVDTATPAIKIPPIDTSFIKDLFSGSNMTTVFWFLAVYFGILIILAVFFKDKLASMQSFIGQIIDVVVFGTLIYYAVYVYYNNRDKDFVTYLKSELKRELSDFNTVIYLGVFLVSLAGFSYVYRMSTMSPDVPFSIDFVSSLGWIYMCVLLIGYFFKYVLKIPFLDDLISPVEKKSDTIGAADEVFNVSNNLYTYSDAQNVCSSFGARLATYDEIETAYNKGAEWCNYGWSEGQMAFFPTQKDTWSVLQRNKAHANDCGRPGVNGGYMANPYIKFGINCYGKKPVASEADLALMSAKKASLTPAPTDATEPKKEWKDAVVNSFNKDKWSVY
jgi:hypothetical protein